MHKRAGGLEHAAITCSKRRRQTPPCVSEPVCVCVCVCVCVIPRIFDARKRSPTHAEKGENLIVVLLLCNVIDLCPPLLPTVSSFSFLAFLLLRSFSRSSQEAYVDSAALAESKLELQEERAAQGLSTEPTPTFEVEEVDDWEVRVGWE